MFNAFECSVAAVWIYHWLLYYRVSINFSGNTVPCTLWTVTYASIILTKHSSLLAENWHIWTLAKVEEPFETE